jgi:hypothetical protein
MVDQFIQLDWIRHRRHFRFSFYKPALCGREQVRGRYLRGQNQRQNEQDDDDGPVHPIVPGLVRVLAQKFLIVE